MAMAAATIDCVVPGFDEVFRARIGEADRRSAV
jgi:hypothetical protein